MPRKPNAILAKIIAALDARIEALTYARLRLLAEMDLPQVDVQERRTPKPVRAATPTAATTTKAS